MSEEKTTAISIVLYDPTGRQLGETFPAGSVWAPRDGRKQNRRRSDSGTGVSAKQRQASRRHRFMSRDNKKSDNENTGDTDAVAA